MNTDDINIHLENVFRNSSSTNELFDEFSRAINNPLVNPEVFKIMLANPVLSLDEIIMFTEQIVKQHPMLSFDYYMWSASVLEQLSSDYEALENSSNYYLRAFKVNSKSNEPLFRLIQLYNTDISLPINKIIINTVIENVDKVKRKSKIYFALADLYRKIGKFEEASKYQGLAEKTRSSE